MSNNLFAKIEKLLFYACSNLLLNAEDVAYKRNRILETTSVFKDKTQTVEFMKQEVFGE